MHRLLGFGIAGLAAVVALSPIAASTPTTPPASAPGASASTSAFHELTSPANQDSLNPRLAAPTGHSSSDRHPEPQTQPATLAEPAQGQTALAAIGDRLDEVAASNEMSSENLTRVLSQDHTAWLGRSGHLFYAEEVKPAAVVADLPRSATAESYPLSQTFNLHSLPGSDRTIYLDFNGYDLAPSNSWVDYQYLPSRSYSGFTLDADPLTFTNTELAHIQTIWRIVAEKYAALDVDVTTEDVGSVRWDRANYSDQQYGTRVVITNDPAASLAACNNGCSGVAWIGQFNANTSTAEYWQPAWVFANMTYGAAALTANTAAHEIGHTLGLDHDGTTTQSYYGGHSNWSPIMGGGVNGVQQFSKGEYTGANNTEDDFTQMAANGVSGRPDEHPNSPANANPVAASAEMDFAGVITTQSDTDVFAITTSCAANFTATATGIGEGSMLDIGLEIHDPATNPMSTADPVSGQNTSYWPARPTGLDAATSATGGIPGTYFFSVRGVGKGNPANTGYSPYSSIGSYELKITATCTDGGVLAGDPPEDPPTDPGEEPTIPTLPRQDGSSAAVPMTPQLRVTSGRRGGPKTIQLRLNAQPTATHYLVAISRVSRGNKRIRVVSVPSTWTELRTGAGRFRTRVLAVGIAGSSGWSTWSVPVRAR